jgi:hypothetical protein
MKVIYLLLPILFCKSFYSQQRVALNSNGNTTIFSGGNPFTDAYNNATDGDTIYLPGGNITFPSVIDKKLTIFGAGHHPDSSITTQKTTLNGNITVSENADSLYIEGIHLTGTLTFTNNHKVDNVTLNRCRINTLSFLGNRTTPCENTKIMECVIDGNIFLNNAQYVEVSNSILTGTLEYAYEVGFLNCIFLYNSTSSQLSSSVVRYTANSYFANNIFMRNSYSMNILFSSSSNTFVNNAFRSVPNEGTNTFVNNYNNTDLDNFFINQTGFVFDYQHDYHLIDPITYIGNDGLEIGLYGGSFPLKTGFIPKNPHFQFKSIAPQTNSNGELNIQVTIEAQ